jgi:hypothetical protein
MGNVEEHERTWVMQAEIPKKEHFLEIPLSLRDYPCFLENMRNVSRNI